MDNLNIICNNIREREKYIDFEKDKLTLKIDDILKENETIKKECTNYKYEYFDSKEKVGKKYAKKYIISITIFVISLLGILFFPNNDLLLVVKFLFSIPLVYSVALYIYNYNQDRMESYKMQNEFNKKVDDYEDKIDENNNEIKLINGKIYDYDLFKQELNSLMYEISNVINREKNKNQIDNSYEEEIVRTRK